MPWTRHCTFVVFGIPKAQPRPQAFVNKKTGHASVYDPGSAAEWKSEVRCAALEFTPKLPFLGPLRVSIDFFLPRPKRLYRKKDPPGLILHTAKPDLDNLVKAVYDALTRVGMWRDDSQVCAGPPRKFYHAKSGRPGARITIEVFQKEPENDQNDKTDHAGNRGPLLFAS